MKKAAYNILPKTEEILQTMGEQIKLGKTQTEFIRGAGRRTRRNQPCFSLEGRKG